MPQPDNHFAPAVICLRPGDKVLVTLVEDPDAELAHEFGAALHEAFPGVEFTIMGGVASVAVMAGTPPQTQVRRIGQ